MIVVYFIPSVEGRGHFLFRPEFSSPGAGYLRFPSESVWLVPGTNLEDPAHKDEPYRQEISRAFRKPAGSASVLDFDSAIERL